MQSSDSSCIAAPSPGFRKPKHQTPYRQDDEGKERKFTTRGEVDLSKPIGIATYNTQGAVRAVKIREIKPE